MRVIVNAPKVTLPVAPGIGAFAIGLPIRNSVDAVRVWFAGCLLQAAPDKILDVVIERFDLALHRELRVLGGEISGLAQSGVVASDFIDAPTLNPVIVVGTQQHL